MPLKKLPDDTAWYIKLGPCDSPEHNPPNMIYLEPGTYEHTCPQCKRAVVFKVYGLTQWKKNK